MSLLPQRKKSAEEIAQLREGLGVHALPEGTNAPAAAGAPDTIIPTPHEATLVHHSEPTEPAEPAAILLQDPVPAPAPHLPKPVRSLRKSEQVPVHASTRANSKADSKLPFHRHSDEEIAAIRRREMFAMMAPPAPNPKLAAAHLVILIPGYLLAVSGASCFFFYEFPMAATAACVAAALLVAAFIFLRRPLSRHHAGFIAVIALFVLVFGALHYFPQLRHAT